MDVWNGNKVYSTLTDKETKRFAVNCLSSRGMSTIREFLRERVLLQNVYTLLFL